MHKSFLKTLSMDSEEMGHVVIFKKEFKELLRDKKTIIFMIGYRFYYSQLFSGRVFFMSSAADKAGK